MKDYPKKRYKKYGFLYFLAILLFIIYFITISIDGFYTGENNIYSKILFLTPFILLLINSFFNRKKNGKND